MEKSKFIICKDIHNKEYKISTAKIEFRPSVYAVIVKNSSVLLVPQWDGYDFPGGGMHKTESIKQAFKREVWEETGLNAEIGALLLCDNDFFYSRSQKQGYNTILMYFSVKNFFGKVTDANFDSHEKTYAKKAEWIKLNNIKRLKFYNAINSVELIRKAEKTYGKRF